jgi:redox-sensing transcriptional repressor
VVGVGNLGQALLEYKGFAAFGVNVLAGFDIQPDGKYSREGKPIYAMNRLRSFCQTRQVNIGIITVPADRAQEVCDHMVTCGIRAIWNFAPINLNVPDHVTVQNENLAVSLTSLRLQFVKQDQ